MPRASTRLRCHTQRRCFNEASSRSRSRVHTARFHKHRIATLTIPLSGGVSLTGEASSAKAVITVDVRWPAVQRPLPPTREWLSPGATAKNSSMQPRIHMAFWRVHGGGRLSKLHRSTCHCELRLGVIVSCVRKRPITIASGGAGRRLEGIRVFHEGNPVGRTDQSGQIVLPRLTPYLANRVTIDERDIPIDVAIRDREMRVVPQFRAGALVEYDARRRTSAILEVRLADGSYLPAGFEVQLAGSSQRYVVGHNGEIFVPDLLASSRFVAELATGRCGFDVEFTALKNENIPKLGPFTCRQLPS